MYLKDVAQATPTEFIELFQIDLTLPSNGEEGIHYFTNSVNTDGSAIAFNSIDYVPIPCKFSGIETSSSGPLPTPTFTIGNINSIFSPLMISYDNCLGASITRLKTFRKYLDGESDASTSAILYSDVWKINRVAMHNNQQIQFELSSAFDLQNIKIPARSVTVNCSHIYRKFDSDTEEFIAGTCPYSGVLYFDANGNPTGQSGDDCGKKVRDCSLRFGQNNVLPMQAFPAVRTLASS